MGSIKLETGKYYFTRSGNKAYVAGPLGHRLLTEAHKGGFQFQGSVDDGMCRSCVWKEDGTAAHSTHDLVAEWTEPKRIKVWAVVMRNCDGSHWVAHSEYASLTEAQSSSFAKDGSCAAIVEISTLEGEGL